MAKNAGCLGEEGKKKQKQDYPLHNSNKKAPCLDDWPAKHSHTCWRRKKKKKNWEKKEKENRTPTKRHKHLVRLNNPFLTGASREQFYHDLLVVSLFYSERDLTDF